MHVEKAGEPTQYEVEFRGLDVFDPVTMELDRREGECAVRAGGTEEGGGEGDR